MTKICPSCNFENEERAKFCKQCGTKLGDNIFNESNFNKNEDNKWAIILTTIAISLMFIIIAGGIANNHSESQTVTTDNVNENYMMGSNLIIHNGTWGSTIKRGNPLLVQLKDSNWEPMEGCVVSLSLKDKKTGETYDGDCTIEEDSYAYLSTDELPLGEYEIYASYYGDEDHYGDNYTDTIEIVD